MTGEVVAGAPDRLQVSGFCWVQLDELADSSDMHVYRAWGHEASIAPNRIENLIAAEDAPLVPHEIFDQANLSGGCIHLFPPHRQDKALGVDFDLSRCNPGCSLRGV